MGLGGSGRFDEQRVEAKQAELDHLEHDGEVVSQAKFDDKLNQEQNDAAVGRGPGPVERFKRWFSARF